MDGQKFWGLLEGKQRLPVDRRSQVFVMLYSTSQQEIALLKQQNQLLSEILKKPMLSNNDVFNAAKSVYKGEAKRRYGDSAAFDPVWG